MEEISIQWKWATYTSILSLVWLLCQWLEGDWEDTRQVLNTFSQPLSWWGTTNICGALEPWSPGPSLCVPFSETQNFLLNLPAHPVFKLLHLCGLEKLEMLFLQQPLDLVSKPKHRPQTCHIPQSSEGLCSHVKDQFFHKLFYFISPLTKHFKARSWVKTTYAFHSTHVLPSTMVTHRAGPWQYQREGRNTWSSTLSGS